MADNLDFLVIGAQKCATTWLHSCLSEHPDLTLPLKKREVEYLGGDLYQEKGRDWYFSLFDVQSEQKKMGDVSVEYLYDYRAPPVVKSFAPNVKLIVSLRNPVDRAVSAFFWHLRKGNIEAMELEEGLHQALIALKAGEPQKANPYLINTLERGYYAVQLERYLKCFDSEQLLVLAYDEVAGDAGDVLKKIYGFLEVDQDFKPSSLASQPKKNSYLKSLIALQRLAPKSLLLGKITDSLNQGMIRLGFGKEKPMLSSQLRNQLQAFFVPHNNELRDLLLKVPEKQRPAFSQMPWIDG